MDVYVDTVHLSVFLKNEQLRSDLGTQFMEFLNTVITKIRTSDI